MRTVGAGIAKIQNLQLLDVSYNLMSSTLPQEWLSTSDLAVLKVDHNSLTGAISISMKTSSGIRTFVPP